MEAETLALAQEMDFSMWSLFARATFIVKLVMLVLILASFWSWSIIIQKLIAYRRARARGGISSIAASGRASRSTACSRRSDPIPTGSPSASLPRA